MTKQATSIMLPVALAVVLLVSAAAAYVALKPAPAPSRATAMAEGLGLTGTFALTDHTGGAVTSDELITGPTLVYFGYTFCPDVCPFDVQRMVDVVDILAENGTDVRPVFITIDPARDDVAALNDYVDAMHPKMVALTGSDEQIAAAAKAYKAGYSKVPNPESAAEYLMNHSVFTYLVTPDGVKALFRRDYPAEQIAEDVEKLLSGGW